LDAMAEAKRISRDPDVRGYDNTIHCRDLPRFAAICRVRPDFRQKCTIFLLCKSRQNVPLGGFIDP